MSSSRMTSMRCAIMPSLDLADAIVREGDHEADGDSLVRSRESPGSVVTSSVRTSE
jgi:hypothetical protein